MNKLKCGFLGALVFSTVLSLSGCATGGLPASYFNDLRVNNQFQNAFNLEPIQSESAKVFLQVKDLSGLNNDAEFDKNLREQFISKNNQKHIEFVNSPNKADVAVYVTLSDVNSNLKMGEGGVETGAIAGAGVGLAVGASSYRDPWGYRVTTIDPIATIGLALIGAGIGYAIDSSNSVQTIYLNSELEVKQMNNGEVSTYSTRISTTAMQRGMNASQAMNQIFGKLGDGIVQMVRIY